MLTSGGGTVNRTRGAFSPGRVLLNNPSDGNFQPNILARAPGQPWTPATIGQARNTLMTNEILVQSMSSLNSYMPNETTGL